MKKEQILKDLKDLEVRKEKVQKSLKAFIASQISDLPKEWAEVPEVPLHEAVELLNVHSGLLVYTHSLNTLYSIMAEAWGVQLELWGQDLPFIKSVKTTVRSKS